MYEVYPNLQQPDDDEMLWRYMSLANFVALLVERYLFFSRLDRLEDPFEGAPSFKVVSVLQVIGRWPQSKSSAAKVERAVGHWREAMRVCRRRVCVNCWHMSDHESEAMWKLYGRLGENVAIVSSLRSLRDCFSESPSVIAGASVEYCDPSKEEVRSLEKIRSVYPDDSHRMHAWASRKSHSYAHEREFRLIHLQADDPTSTAHGIHFAVDPSPS